MPTLLAKGLAERGHTVTVVTGFPNYPTGRIYPGYRQRLLQRENGDGVRLLRLPMYPDHSRSLLKRTAYYVSFAISASCIAPFTCGRTDVIWVHQALTLGLAAQWLGLLLRAPFVLNVQDIYPETLRSMGKEDDSKVSKLVGMLAKFVYQRSSAISVISPGFKRNLIRKGLPESKIHFIPNWADELVYRPLAPDPGLAEDCGMAGRFNILYGGNFGPPQGLGTLLDAAAMLADLPDVQFVLIGDGVDRITLEREVEARRLPNVRLIPRQPEERMPHYYALADVLLVHLIDEPIFEITIPGKTLSYLASGRPLLMAVRGDAAEVVRQARAGITAQPSDPGDLARAVRDFYKMPAEQRQAMGRSAREYYSAHFTLGQAIDSYEKLFEEVARRRRQADPVRDT